MQAILIVTTEDFGCDKIQYIHLMSGPDPDPGNDFETLGDVAASGMRLLGPPAPYADSSEWPDEHCWVWTFTKEVTQ